MIVIRRSALFAFGPSLLLNSLLSIGCSGDPEREVAPPLSVTSAEIEAVFTEFDVPDSPGVAVMVVEGGDVVHARGYGLADLETGQAFTPTTPVRLASVTKQFTATAVMLLAEQGVLAYDDPAVTWVPELSRYTDVTIRHLLNHTAGLPDYYDGQFHADLASADEDPLLTNVDGISIYETWGDPVFSPGKQFEYSNPGYEVLGLIIERASGMTFGRFLQENIFLPLGMTTAVVRDRPELRIPDRAVGYRRSGDGADSSWEEHDDHFGNWMVGAGGLYASLDDLYRWDQALSRGQLVSRETLAEAFSPAVLSEGTSSPYGFGWALTPRADHPAVHHNGGWVGFRTAMIRFTEIPLTVIVLSNASAAASDLADQVSEIVLNESRID